MMEEEEARKNFSPLFVKI
jgi:hypothetical protein